MMDDYVINNIHKMHKSFYHSFEASCKLHQNAGLQHDDDK